MTAFEVRSDVDESLPASWAALPAELRKAFWTVRETVLATGISRSVLYRRWGDPRSTFPRRHPSSGRVSSLAVLRHLEES